MSAAAVTVAGLAWLGSIAFVVVGVALQHLQRVEGGSSLPGTVLAARSRSETTQDLVIGVSERRRRRPDAVIRMVLRRARLAEGQPVEVALRPDGRVRLGLRPLPFGLSRPLLAYLAAIQLAAIGLLALVMPV
jgi:hypothetical protein